MIQINYAIVVAERAPSDPSLFLLLFSFLLITEKIIRFLN
jgi:hypothetical protein